MELPCLLLVQRRLYLCFFIDRFCFSCRCFEALRALFLVRLLSAFPCCYSDAPVLAISGNVNDLADAVDFGSGVYYWFSGT